MNTVGKVITAIIVVGIIAAGGYAIFHKKNSTSNSASQTTTQNSSNTQPASSAPTTTAPAAATITYGSNGFSPAVTTVKSGDTVKITNTSSEAMSLNSDPHPTHTDDPDLNVGTVDAGQSKTFVVTKTGNWGFHNHFDPSDRGRIEVQ